MAKFTKGYSAVKVKIIQSYSKHLARLNKKKKKGKVLFKSGTRKLQQQ